MLMIKAPGNRWRSDIQSYTGNTTATNSHCAVVIGVFVAVVTTAGCSRSGSYEYQPGTDVYPSALQNAAGQVPMAVSESLPSTVQTERRHALGDKLRFYALPRKDAVVLFASIRVLSRLTEASDKPDAHQLDVWQAEAISFDENLEPLTDWALDGENGAPLSEPLEFSDPKVPHESEQVSLAYSLWAYGTDSSDPLALVAAVRLFANSLPDEQAPPPGQLLKALAVAAEVADPLPCNEILGELIDRESHRLANLVGQSRKVRSGSDWPGFLGPTGDGKSAETGLRTGDGSEPAWLAKADSGPKLLWEREVGAGFGSCCVRGRQLFVLDRVDDNVRLTCIDAVTGDEYRHPDTGERAWPFPYSYHSGAVSPGGYSGPRASPLIDEDRIYILDEEGVLTCVDIANGHKKWQVHTQQVLGTRLTPFGVSASPVIEGELIIIVTGGEHKASQNSGEFTAIEHRPHSTPVIALNKFNGQVEYKVGNDVAGYSSPIVKTIHNERVGLAYLQSGLFAFDPLTGTTRFRFHWQGRNPHSVNASTPIVMDDQIFLSSGHAKGSVLLRRESAETSVVWADENGAQPDRGMEAGFATPILHDGYVYGCSGDDSDDAEIRCIDWNSGQLKWPVNDEQKSLVRLNRTSMLYVDGYFICLSEYGQLYLLEADPNQPVITEIPLQRDLDGDVPVGFTPPPLLRYPCWTAPVLAHGLLYLRDQSRLICLDLIPVPGDMGN